MRKLSLREKSNVDLGEKILLFKNTVKRWFYYAGLKFLQTHDLSEEQESFLSDITDFFVDSIEELEENSDFIKKIKLAPVKPTKRVR